MIKRAQTELTKPGGDLDRAPAHAQNGEGLAIED
jgi:hypothetical protein